MKIDGSKSWNSTCDKGPRTYLSVSLLQLAEYEMSIFITHKAYNMATELFYSDFIFFLLKH